MKTRRFPLHFSVILSKSCSTNSAYHLANGLMSAFIAVCIIVSGEVSSQSTPPNAHWAVAPGQGFSSDWAQNITQTHNGKFISAGYAYSPCCTTRIPSMVLVDAMGVIVWEKIFEGANGYKSGAFDDVLQLADHSGYAAIGTKGKFFSSTSAEHQRAFFVIVDNDGNVIEEKYIGFTTSDSTMDDDYKVRAHSMRELPGGGFVVAGSVENSAVFTGKMREMMLLYLDSDGDVTGSLVIPGSNVHDAILSVRLLYSGYTLQDGSTNGTFEGFIFTGVISNGSENDMIVGKTNITGSSIDWFTTINSDPGDTPNFPSMYSKVFNETGPCSPSSETFSDVGRTLEQISDGNIIVGGFFNQYSSTCTEGPYYFGEYNDADAVIIKIDSDDGSLIFAKNVSHVSGWDFHGEVHETNDNGFVFLASTSDPSVRITGTRDDIFLIKTDSDGDVEWRKPFIVDASTSLANCAHGLAYCSDGGFIVSGNDKDHAGSGKDNYIFVKFGPDCPLNTAMDYPSGLFIGSGTVTWNSSKIIGGPVIVSAGAKLAITGSGTTIQFLDSKDLMDCNNPAITSAFPVGIIVQQGGELEVDGALLTGITGCNGLDYMWQGVQVHGFPGNYSGPTTHGKVILKNGASIRNARIGILANSYSGLILDQEKYPIEDIGNSGGGTIQATNASFINCRTGVYFASFPNSSTNTSASFFKACLFKNDDFMADKSLWHNIHNFRLANKSFVVMKEISGVAFLGNTFESTIVPDNKRDMDMRGTGITSYDSKYRVGKFGTTIGEFKNLYYGIRAENSTNMYRNISVKESKFISCGHGIITRGMHWPEILSNEFSINDTDPLYFEGVGGIGVYGVYMDQCNAYGIQENQMESDIMPWDVYGSIINHSGVNANEVYKNSFEGLTVAEQAQGINGNAYYGLTYFCNSHTDVSFADIAVSSGRISPQQGACSFSHLTAARNTFSHTCNGAVNPYSDLMEYGGIGFNYSHNQDVSLDQKPICYTGSLLVNECNTSCPPVGDCCPSKLPGNCNIPCLMDLMEGWTENIDDATVILQSGNSTALYDVIETGTEPDIVITLTAASPYLSDGVLLALIEREIDEVDFKDLIKMNSPLTEDVLLMVLELNLEDSIHDSIRSFQEGISGRKLKENELIHYKSQIQLSVHDLIRRVAADTLVSLDSSIIASVEILSMLEPSAEKYCMLASAWMSLDSLDLASVYCDSIAEFDPENSYRDLMLLMISLKDTGGTVWDYIDNPDFNAGVQDLSIGYFDGTPGSANAKSIIDMVDHKYMPEYIETLSLPAERQGRIIQDSQSAQLNSIRLYPNPASSLLTVEIPLNESLNEAGSVSVFDFSGREVIHTSVSGTDRILKYDISFLSSGIYFVSYRSHTKGKISGKLIISR